MYFRQLLNDQSACASYLLGCKTHSTFAVVDPHVDLVEDYIALAGPHWRNAFGFVDPADEPVIRKFFTDMIGHFSELIRKERGR